MRLSTRSRYGIRLVVHPGENFEKGYTQLKEAAKGQVISMKYLEQIVIPLKKAGLIEGVRGARGDYRLVKTPEAISVGEIVAVLEEGETLTLCAEDPKACERSESCPTRKLWKKTSEVLWGKMNSVSLADLARKRKKK